MISLNIVFVLITITLSSNPQVCTADGNLYISGWWIAAFYQWICVIVFMICSLSLFKGIIGTMMALSLILLIMVLIYCCQGRILYRAVTRDGPRSPSDNPQGKKLPRGQLGKDYENLVVVCEDGVKLRGWVIKHPKPERIIVFFHGSSKNIGFRLRFLNCLKDKTNSTVVVVAYRGYSDSQGTSTQKGIRYDSKAIINKVKQYRDTNCSELDIYVFGRSLGGAVAIYVCSELAKSKIIKGLIVENTFTSISDLIDDTFPVIKPFKCMLANHWRSIDRIGMIECPILFIQGMKDTLIPPSHTARLIHQATNTIHLQTHQIPQGRHSKCWDINIELYFREVNKFLNTQT